MKGKTSCPKCNHEIITDMPENTDKHDINCPKCKHSFTIKRTSNLKLNNEEAWEEYGEPRKTILSSIKKKTNKPIIASFLLLATAILGIFTAVIYSSNNGINLQQFDFITSNLTWLPFNDLVLSSILIIFSIFALVGSITVFKRRFFVFTAVCAFLGIFSIGLFVGLVFAIVALELIIVSRDEFENGTKGKVF